MSWGCDTHLYATAQEFREQFPRPSGRGEARVLKQYRGNGGNGVWKVELIPSFAPAHRADPIPTRPPLGPRAASGMRSGAVSRRACLLGDFLARCEPYFARFRPHHRPGLSGAPAGGDGPLLSRAGQGRRIRTPVDQRPVPRAARRRPGEAPQPGPRLYHPPDHARLPAGQGEDGSGVAARPAARCSTSTREVAARDLGRRLPLRPEDGAGEDTYVLCEINVSSVSPFPDEALPALARETRARPGRPRGGLARRDEPAGALSRGSRVWRSRCCGPGPGRPPLRVAGACDPRRSGCRPLR